MSRRPATFDEMLGGASVRHVRCDKLIDYDFSRGTWDCRSCGVLMTTKKLGQLSPREMADRFYLESEGQLGTYVLVEEQIGEVRFTKLVPEHLTNGATKAKIGI